MGKRNNSRNFNASKDDSITWTPHMDDALIDAYVYQTNVGNRVGGTFTSKAYDLILQELSEKFPDVHFDKEKIKNHMKYIKRVFGPCN
jgi:Myb/SANT-like DNA-binding domain